MYLVAATFESVTKADRMISTRPIAQHRLLGEKEVRRPIDRRPIHNGIENAIGGRWKIKKCVGKSRAGAECEIISRATFTRVLTGTGYSKTYAESP
jgi:hypothetical protein